MNENVFNAAIGVHNSNAWNASAANGVMREIEQILNAQAPHMQDTIAAHNREIGRMINALSQLAATANTSSCPDTRAAAQRQMNEYQRRISTLQTAVMNLQRGIDDLQTGTSTLRRQLGTTQETLQETDRQLAERIRSNNDLMNVAIRRVQNIMEGIEMNFPNLAGGLLRGNRLDRQQFMFPDGALFGYDEHGNFVFNWEEIARIWNKSFNNIEYEEWIALINAYIVIENVDDLQRFIRLIPDLVPNSNHSAWRICTLKSATFVIGVGMVLESGVEVPNRADLMQRHALLLDLISVTSQNGIYISGAPSININIVNHGQGPLMKVTVPTIRRINAWNEENIDWSRPLNDQEPIWVWFDSHTHVWTVTPGLADMYDIMAHLIQQQRDFNEATFGGSLTLSIIDSLVSAGINITTGVLTKGVGTGVKLTMDVMKAIVYGVSSNHSSMSTLNIANTITDAAAIANLGNHIPLDFTFSFHSNGTTIVRVHEVFPSEGVVGTQAFIDAVVNSVYFKGLVVPTQTGTSGNAPRPMTLIRPEEFTVAHLLQYADVFDSWWGSLEYRIRNDILEAAGLEVPRRVQ